MIDPLLVPRPYRVVETVREHGADTVTLWVEPCEGELPTFEPGQVSMLGAFGIGEAAISVSSSRREPAHHAYTIRRAGPISAALTETPAGGTITVRGPFGTAWPLDAVDTPDLLIVAGGLGLAPLRAAIDAATARVAAGRTPPRRVRILYGARTPDDLLYPDDLDRWAAGGADVARIVDVADPAWSGPVGRIPDLIADVSPTDRDGADVTAFVCGPDVMMDAVASALISRGVPPSQIWFTLERNMQCGNALCGHCQLGPFVVCHHGPVIDYGRVGRYHQVREL